MAILTRRGSCSHVRFLSLSDLGLPGSGSSSSISFSKSTASASSMSGRRSSGPSTASRNGCSSASSLVPAKATFIDLSKLCSTARSMRASPRSAESTSSMDFGVVPIAGWSAHSHAVCNACGEFEAILRSPTPDLDSMVHWFHASDSCAPSATQSFPLSASASRSCITPLGSSTLLRSAMIAS